METKFCMQQKVLSVPALNQRVHIVVALLVGDAQQFLLGPIQRRHRIGADGVERWKIVSNCGRKIAGPLYTLRDGDGRHFGSSGARALHGFRQLLSVLRMLRRQRWLGGLWNDRRRAGRSNGRSMSAEIGGTIAHTHDRLSANGISGRVHTHTRR